MSLKQMQDYARIDAARPGAHAESVERGEAESVIDALAVPHGTQARAASQVRDDYAAVRDLGRHLGQYAGDVLVREAVKAVALHARVAKLPAEAE